MICVLVVIILACLAVWVTQKLLAAFGIPPPFSVVIYVIVVVLAVVYVLSSLTGLPRVYPVLPR